MAKPIRSIPILTGKAAERFVRLAAVAQKHPHTQVSDISPEDFQRFLSTAEFH